MPVDSNDYVINRINCSNRSRPVIGPTRRSIPRIASYENPIYGVNLLITWSVLSTTLDPGVLHELEDTGKLPENGVYSDTIRPPGGTHAIVPICTINLQLPAVGISAIALDTGDSGAAWWKTAALVPRYYCCGAETRRFGDGICGRRVGEGLCSGGGGEDQGSGEGCGGGE